MCTGWAMEDCSCPMMAAAILRTWRKKWTGSNLESLLYNISIQVKSRCTPNPVRPSDQLGMGEVARCIIIEEFAGRSCFHLKSISRILLQKRSECVLMWCIFSCWLFKSALFGLYLVTWERNLVLWPTSWFVGCLSELGLRSPFPLDVVCDWLVFSVEVWEVVLFHDPKLGNLKDIDGDLRPHRERFCYCSWDAECFSIWDETRGGEN